MYLTILLWYHYFVRSNLKSSLCSCPLENNARHCRSPRGYVRLLPSPPAQLGQRDRLGFESEPAHQL